MNFWPLVFQNVLNLRCVILHVNNVELFVCSFNDNEIYSWHTHVLPIVVQNSIEPVRDSQDCGRFEFCSDSVLDEIVSV